MRHLLLYPLLVGALAGCTENTIFKNEDELAGLDPGSIIGRVCSPSGRTWLADAMAYAHLIDADGRLYDTRISYTDRDGFFLLDDMPAGHTYTVYVQFGDEILETHTVAVDEREDVQIDEPDCFDPLELDVAVVTGDYDEFQDVLDHMGFANYEVVDGLYADEMAGFLMDLDTMLQYDIIVFNGGHVEEGLVYEVPEEEEEEEGPGSIFGDDDTGSADEDGDDTGMADADGGSSTDDIGELPGVDDTGEADADEEEEVEETPTLSYNHEVIHNNIKAYVNSGGAIYASDWAYDVVEQIWPEAINFVGADEIPDSAQMGEYGMVTATVADDALAEWLDADYTQVEFDLPVWPPIEGVADTVSVHLTGNIEYRDGTNIFPLTASPLLVSFTSGEGKVAFSTFRVAKNADSEIILTLQYMMYSL
jgi:hypothetical protein